MSDNFVFERIALIGIGLINSSIARFVKKYKLAHEVVIYSRRQSTLDKAMELGFAERAETNIRSAVLEADLIILGVPVGANLKLVQEMAPSLKVGAIVTDVGSVKAAVIRDIKPHLPSGVHFVPAHPVAGTEHSGPEAGFAELFQDHWCIITPPDDCDASAVQKVVEFWKRAGSRVEVMDATHHDKVLAITSHLPHLIAFNIVGTAADIETVTEKEVVKYAAGGFQDFTRIAASDPEMWRDIFLNNQEAVLEMLGRFTEDMAALQKAIRWKDGEALEALFSRTRRIRRDVIKAKQS